MRKAFLTLITLVLLFGTLVSCSSATDDMFLNIVHASKKSTYNCLSYVGTYDGKYYIRTKSDGIIYFAFDKDFNADKEVKTVNTGDFISIRGAYIYENKLYAINADGDLFVKDLSKEDAPEKIKEKYYKSLKKNGIAIVDGTGKVEHLPCDSHAEIAEIASCSDITRVFAAGDKDYVANDKDLYLIEETSVSKIDLNGKQTKDILNITAGENGVSYIVFSNLEIHAIESGVVISEKSGDSNLFFEPTSAFAYDKYIAYKTTGNIELFDTVENKIIHNYKDKWAEDLYANSTSISEFIKIDKYFFSINDNGGIYRIDTVAGTASSIFTE